MARAQKKCAREGRVPVFVDESGFYLLPGVVKTWAPIGKTPILLHKLTRDHLSVISGITESGRLFMQVRERSLKSGDCIGFLEHLQRHLRGPLLVVWDGASIHRSKAVQQYLADGGATGVQLASVPGYAPDLNPAEGIWRYLKYVELRNLCCPSLVELQGELRRAKERLRHKTALIQACFRKAGYH